MARAQKNSSKTRGPRSQLTITLSPELKGSLEEAAKSLGMNLSEYIRHRVFGFAESRMESAYREGVEIKHGPSYPSTWEEFYERSSVRFVELSDTVNSWRNELYRSDKARKLGLSSSFELDAMEGKILGFDDPNKTPMQRLEEVREYMRSQSEKQE